MKSLCEPEIHKWRRVDDATVQHFGGIGDETCGAFVVPGPFRVALFCIASSGEGWDHVSVSLPNRCPVWEEMEFLKRLFFKPDETVMQLHVPPTDHINTHRFTLHLWRPQREPIPRPPAIFV